MISLPNPNSTLEILNFLEFYFKLSTLKNNIRDGILVKEQTMFVIQMSVCSYGTEKGEGETKSQPRSSGLLGC